MTREEAWRSAKGYLYDALSGEEADEIIKALEQEPCEDSISRQAVIEFLKGFEILHNHDELRSNLIYGIMNMSPIKPQETRWIPVSERLPEEGGDYLVTLCFDICCTGTVREVRKNFFCILSKKWLYEDEDVIAWMPLPKPYEPQEREVQDAGSD